MLVEEKYGLPLTERCQFMYRNVVLRNYTKEEIIVERALHTKAIYKFLGKSVADLQTVELSEWVLWNIFKRGITLEKTGRIEITFQEGDI